MKKIAIFVIPLIAAFSLLGFLLAPQSTLGREDEDRGGVAEGEALSGDDSQDDVDNNEEGDDASEEDKVTSGGNDDSDASRDRDEEESSSDDEREISGDDHRGVVGEFVQGLLDVADREKGEIGEKIRTVAQEQNDDKDNIATAIDKIQKRNGIIIFLIGADYKNIGQLRSTMVKTENQINQLTGLLDRTSNAESRVELEAQIQLLDQEQQKLDDLLRTNESKFSLFGWFVKLFSR